MSGLAVAGGRAAAPDAVERMLAASPHRGVERRVATVDRVCLGVTMDPALPAGDVHVAGGRGLAVAGVVDNLADLAAAAGCAPSAGSAAVLLAAHERWGEALPQRMRGQYAVAVTDGVRVAAWRDHVGFAPLFYRAEPDLLLLATEAKQVVAGTGRTAEPDLDAVEAIFHKRYDDETPAALRGVRRLRKATLFDWRPGSSGHRSRYWHPERLLETARYRPDELAERFVATFRGGVRRMLTGADCVSLSGGIDSPAVAAFAAEGYTERFGRPLGALTTVYPQHPEVDEQGWVELVAARLGIDLHMFEPTVPHLARVDHWMGLLDGPVPTVLISELEDFYVRARGHGYRTILSGELAEYVVDRRGYLMQHLLTRGRFGPLRRELAGQHARGASYPRLGLNVAVSLLPKPVKVALVAGRRRPVRMGVPPWVDPDRHRVPGPAAGSPTRQRWREEQFRFLDGPGFSLEADDVIQAACGVRVRRPFVDIDFWEFWLSLPAEVKYPDHVRKGLLRSLLRGRVPDEILDRKVKVVFDSSIMARVDYPELRRRLVDPPYRMPGVDYRLLAERLAAERMGLHEYIWAKDLAGVHAFLARWS